MAFLLDDVTNKSPMLLSLDVPEIGVVVPSLIGLTVNGPFAGGE
jgi:hypothetical protein